MLSLRIVAPTSPSGVSSMKFAYRGREEGGGGSKRGHELYIMIPPPQSSPLKTTDHAIIGGDGSM